jgi:hypothetical protein
MERIEIDYARWVKKWVEAAMITDANWRVRNE